MYCCYKHCLHPGTEISNNGIVLTKDRSMHNDCFDYYCTIKKIVYIYQSEVSRTIPAVELQTMINDMVFKKSLSPHYILFVLRYAINKGFDLSNASKLRYYAGFEECKKIWKERQFILGNNIVVAKPPTDYKYTPTKATTILDVV